MSRRASGSQRRSAAVVATAMSCMLAIVWLQTGCQSAVKHPAVTAGVVAGVLGFTTCKLASDSYPTCGIVAGGAGVFLGLIAAGALWLGGDGASVVEQERALPIPDDGSPRRPRKLPPAEPAPPASPPALPAPAPPAAP